MGYYRNSEGYYDGTAGRAIANVFREERKKAMGKTRSCRRTEDQNRIHDKAVKMRKMTDEQLVHYVEDRVEKARSEGYNQAKKEVPDKKSDDTYIIRKFIEQISSLSGIGHATINKIRILARNEGYIGESK